MKICPDCKDELIEVSFDSEKAGKIHCFYCGKCGGAFFDHWDSNLLTLDDIRRELGRLFKEEEENLPASANPICPIDQAAMTAIESEAVPAGIKVFFCPTCRGNWFPKGELIKFKQQQSEKISGFKKMHVPLGSIMSVFLPVFFVAIVTGLTIYMRTAVLNKTAYQTQASVFHKMLQMKLRDKDTVEISFFTEEPSKSVVYYQSTGSVLNKAENDFSRYHFLVINDLTNASSYLFQIQTKTSEGKEYNSEWLSAK